MSGPTNTIYNPTQYAHNEPGAFPDIMRGAGQFGSTGADTGAGGPIGGNGPTLAPTYVQGGTNATYYNDITNGYATWHISQDTNNWKAGDTFKGLPTFIKQIPESQWGPQPRNRSYEMFGIAELNRRLREDPAMRKRYGTQLDTSLFFRDYAYIGVQQSLQTQLYDSPMQHMEENNFVVEGRVAMPNIWLAQHAGAGVASCVSELHTLWLVVRRRKYHGADAAKADMWGAITAVDAAMAPVAKRSMPADFVTLPSAVAPKLDVATLEMNLKRMSEMDTDNPWKDKDGKMDGMLKDDVGAPNTKPTGGWTPAGNPTGKAGEYYLCIEPVASCDRKAPHPCLYSGDPVGDPDNQFVGDRIHIGQVIHVIRGPNNRAPSQVKLARNVLYEHTTRGADYLQSLHQLDILEVHLQAGRT